MSYVLGIDVGAARTSAAVARPGSDDVEPVDLGDGGCGVASVLHLGADGSLDVGAAAERWADGEPERVVRGFPGRIGDDVPMLLAGEPWAPEELTAWLVRWVVDRVAEREDGPAAGIAVTRPATWDDDRIELLAGALAEQDLDVTFLTTARGRRVAHPRPAGRLRAVASGPRRAARRSPCLPVDVEAERTDDVAARMAALARFPGIPAARTGDARTTAHPPRCRHPHPRLGATGRPVTRRLPTGHGPSRRATSGRGPVRTRPRRGSGGHPVAMRAPGGRRRRPEHMQREPDRGGPRAHRRRRGRRTICSRRSAGSPAPWAPPTPRACCRGTRRRPGWRLSATGSRATALTVVETDEPLALPAQRNGSGRWAAVSDDEEADERERRTRRRHRPSSGSAARPRW